MREFCLRHAICALRTLSNWALAVDAWCFDRCYDMGEALVNERRRIRSQIIRRR